MIYLFIEGGKKIESENNMYFSNDADDCIYCFASSRDNEQF